MSRKRKVDEEALLKDFFANDLRALRLDPAKIEMVLSRFRYENFPQAIAARTRRGRTIITWTGVVALGLLAFWMIPRISSGSAWSSSSANSVALPGDATGLVPAARLSSLTNLAMSSHGHRLWALGHEPGHWTLYESGDRGHAWKSVLAIQGERWAKPALGFFGANRGWLLVPSVSREWAARATLDGGNRWNPVTLPRSAALFRGIGVSAPVSSRIYLWLSSGPSSNPVQLYEASGAGHPWTVIRSAGLPDTISSLWFSSKEVGYLVPGVNDGLMQTADGGYRWSLAPATNGGALSSRALSAAPRPPSTSIARMSFSPMGSWQFLHGLADFVTPHVGFLYQRGFLWRTSNGGTTWHRKASLPFPGIPRALAFTNALNGYAISAGGQLWMTQNGGVSWVR